MVVKPENLSKCGLLNASLVKRIKTEAEMNSYLDEIMELLREESDEGNGAGAGKEERCLQLASRYPGGDEAFRSFAEHIWKSMPPFKMPPIPAHAKTAERARVPLPEGWVRYAPEGGVYAEGTGVGPPGLHRVPQGGRDRSGTPLRYNVPGFKFFEFGAFSWGRADARKTWDLTGEIIAPPGKIICGWSLLRT